MNRNIKLALISGLFAVSQCADASLIPTELSVNASLTFDTANSTLTSGAQHESSMVSDLGGVNSNSFVNGLTVSGSPTIGGSFTELNQSLQVGGSTSGNFGADSDVFFDYHVDLTNNSLTEAYTITFLLALDDVVDADGIDAFGLSEFFIQHDSGVELFFSEISSDTVFGDVKTDSINGDAGLSTFGNVISNTLNYGFAFTLAAGESTSFSAVVNLTGLAAQGGDRYSANSFSQLSLVSVVGGPPVSVPLPATLLLMITGIALIVQRNK